MTISQTHTWSKQLGSPVHRATLSRNAKRYEDIRSISGCVISLAFAWLVVAPLVPQDWGTRAAVTLSVLALVVTTVEVFVLNVRLRRYFVMTFDDGALCLHTGKILVTDASVRTDAILSVDEKHGPILRSLGLAKLKLHGIAAFPDIPALDRADAERLRVALTRPDNDAAEGSA